MSVSVGFLAAPASAIHCDDVTTPYVYEGPDNDGDGKPDYISICVGQDDVARFSLSLSDYTSTWNGDHYTSAYASAATDWNSPVGSNYASTGVSCQDEGGDGSGCDGYSVSLYASTYGTTGHYVSVSLYEPTWDDNDDPRLCVYTSETGSVICEELAP